jgi:hypothetical protein
LRDRASAVDAVGPHVEQRRQGDARRPALTLQGLVSATARARSTRWVRMSSNGGKATRVVLH